MAYVAIERDGVAGIGSAFHIGDGIFVTARHVLENANVTEMRMTDTDLFYRSELYPKGENGAIIITKDSPDICLDPDDIIAMAAGPFFHPDASIDIAAFRASGIAEKAHYIPLGGHLDDWIGRSDFELSEAVILGYPPIPFTSAPILVAVRAEVNAVVDPRGGGGPHFIFSAMPRGGFSGGVAISEWNFAFGVVTQSLLSGDLPSELGFFTTTSVEVVYDLLVHHKLLPKCQTGWGGPYDSET
jgi:hypothetical protein